jgi:hypothetical protein
MAGVPKKCDIEARSGNVQDGFKALALIPAERRPISTGIVIMLRRDNRIAAP